MIDKCKKVLIVDDSALMRRVICDIIQSDDRFVVTDLAANGVEALDYMEKRRYDVVILDIEMPKKDGLTVLKELKEKEIAVNVVVFSGADLSGADITIQALELGAFDFIRKPNGFFGVKKQSFVQRFLDILYAAATAEKKTAEKTEQVKVLTGQHATEQPAGSANGSLKKRSEQKPAQIVAIASSTGGPKALQTLLPMLPADLSVPVLIVQHMPAGFTQSLAQRLDELSQIHVKEAQDGEALVPGTVYIAKGGLHMEVRMVGARTMIALKDGPTREGVRPCANFMYESLAETDYESIACVVLTGMGADGTEGIMNLSKEKQVTVIAQDQATSVVYGMPRSIFNTGIVDWVEPIGQVAEAIIKSVGVQ